jgi:hypothetical protein
MYAVRVDEWIDFPTYHNTTASSLNELKIVHVCFFRTKFVVKRSTVPVAWSASGPPLSHCHIIYTTKNYAPPFPTSIAGSTKSSDISTSAGWMDIHRLLFAWNLHFQRFHSNPCDCIHEW